jgi:Cof subfamily protein (haloacid dehalogenase superfamily)
MIKALFFDIDGTLVSFQTHLIPDSTVDALRKAKANGVKVFISTGRPVSIINNLSQIETLIDGYITTNGAYCFIGNEEVCCHEMQRKDVEIILKDSDRKGYPTVVVGEKSFVVHNNGPLFERIFQQGLKVDNIDFSKTYDDIRNERILQVTPFITAEQEAELAPELHDCTLGRWHPAFVDITAKGIDKARGLLAMAQFEHLDVAETMAFGDGGNDIPIIRQAGVGVAMGNGLVEVKKSADYVTTPIDEDGVRNALLHYQVIA